MLQPIGDQFAALLTTADVGQVAFDRLAGVNPCQVNKCCRNHARSTLGDAAGRRARAALSRRLLTNTG